MKQTLSNHDEIGYLFNVDILIKSRSNALALQSLIEFINKEEQVADFRIHSGIELGKIIETMLETKKITSDSDLKKQESSPSPGEKLTSTKPNKAVDSASKKKTTSDTSHVADASSFDAWIESLIKENRLTRIVVNNKNGKHQSIPCRILNFDRDNSVVTIYHVDEKQVYTFRTNEIDEFLT
ncbi:MAG: hypothetical protein IKE29_17290 [Paenibacillus sp.]|uniref:hypothetical protein n=1 Tax=Paenibacillus sp. TaxID=58172 RepID=UPI0025D8B84D|nr:hypothetical protein [Paenibacillus sp.]MBR2566355.1 hypothetical protein [Paenibacillus sp.]